MLRRLIFDLYYMKRPPWDTGVSPPELLTFIAEHPAGRAVDLGCGTGTNLVSLARAGWQVNGVDFGLGAVLRARGKLRKAGLSGRVIHGDVSAVRRLALPFDLVLDVGCYHGLNEQAREKYRQILEQILAPGGHFLLYAHLSGAPAIEEDEFTCLSARLKLVQRQDSPDNFGRRAVWALFQQSPASPAETGRGEHLLPV